MKGSVFMRACIVILVPLLVAMLSPSRVLGDPGGHHGRPAVLLGDTGTQLVLR
jgi:hypothetical protein